MLQDWPGQKAKLEGVLIEAIRKTALRNAPITAQTSRFTLVEGESLAFVHPDGNRTPVNLQAHEAKVQFTPEEVLHDGLGTIEKAVRELGGTLGRDMDASVVRRMRELPPGLGATFRGDSSHDLETQMMEALEALQVDFDEEGKPELAIVVHPDTVEKLAKLDQDPEASARMNVVMERKRNEWVARESRRRLVD